MSTRAKSVTPLRIAVAGVGSFTQRVVIPGLLACPDANLVALFGPTREKTERIAAEHGIPAAFDDYTALLQETPLDAIFIATPNDAHYAMVMSAIERGLAVACEKPLAPQVAPAREMTAAARRAGVPTAVNFSYRSITPCRHIAALLAAAELGTIYHFSIAFLQDVKANPSLPLVWRMQAERGGGTLNDIGTHLFDLVRWWFGEIAAVCGDTRIVIGARRGPDGATVPVTADDMASCLVRLQSGLVGTVQVSQVAHGRQNYRHMALYGSAGSVVAVEERTFGPEVRLARPGGSFQVVSPPAEVQVAFDDYPAFHLGRIVRTLRGEATDFPTFEDGLRAQATVEAVLISQREGRWVDLPAGER